MAGMVLRKTGTLFLMIFKLSLQMLLWILRVMAGMTKLFLLLFLLVVRVVLVMTGVAGNRR